jgi:hypothetical protein
MTGDLCENGGWCCWCWLLLTIICEASIMAFVFLAAIFLTSAGFLVGAAVTPAQSPPAETAPAPVPDLMDPSSMVPLPGRDAALQTAEDLRVAALHAE